MIEGMRLASLHFLYKREEAERKMEKTAENMREVESLRRELAPQCKVFTITS